MKGLVGVVLGACCAIVIACSSGMRQAPTQMSQPPRAPTMAPRPSSPEADQIDQLVAEIDQARTSIDVPEQHGAVEPATAGVHGTTVSPANVAPVAPTTMTCKPQGQSDTCKQTCTLSDSICGNAKKICDIAGQMGGDAWAAQKCADGNATCGAATKKCCDCMP